MRNTLGLISLVGLLISGCNSPSGSTSSTTVSAGNGSNQPTPTTTPTVSYSHFVYSGYGFQINELGVDPVTSQLVGLVALNGEPDTFVSTTAEVSNMLITPNAKFLYYIYNPAGGDANEGLGEYSINQTSGLLTKIGTGFINVTKVYKFAIDASGQNIYTEWGAAFGFSQYSINQTTGALTYVGSQTFTSQAQSDAHAVSIGLTMVGNVTPTTSVTVDSNTYEVYNTDERIDLYQNGVLTSYSTYTPAQSLIGF